MNLEDLGRRAVACKHWRWMPGMLASDPGGNTHRVIWHDEGEKYAQTVLRDYDDAHVESSVPVDGVIPDLSDPATLGCLLHLVREAWPDEWHKHVVPMWNGRDGWAVGCIGADRNLILLATPDGMFVGLGNSEAGALVSALEGAP